MSNIIDIPAVVPALVSFFIMGGTDTAITLTLLRQLHIKR